NLKYWTRQPYLGFGVDAHSMLRRNQGQAGVRFSNPDAVEKYLAGDASGSTEITMDSALEEAFFLGLRLNRGINLEEFAAQFGQHALAAYSDKISELLILGLLEREDNLLRLTAKGRLLSNEVFERFVSIESTV